MGTYQTLGTLLVLALCVVTGSAIMCSVCDSNMDPQCKENAPPPVNCTICQVPLPEGGCAFYTAFNYCLSVEKFDENSTLISYTRSCSPITSSKKPYYCKHGEENNKKIRMCFFFCGTDGCNAGFVVKAPVASVMVGLLVTWTLRQLFMVDHIYL